MNLQPGDIFLTKGDNFVSKGIRFFSRSKGESRTEANHVGIVVHPGTHRTAKIVEALTTVKTRTMASYYDKDNTEVAIYRPINVSAEDLLKIRNKANSYVGMKYGYIKIVAHFLDWCIGGRYFFRRFAFMNKYPICSWVVAYAYAEAGYNFGVEPGGASPDDIMDFCEANPDKYVWLHPMGRLR